MQCMGREFDFDKNPGKWMYFFYLSKKFIEFIDTWIVILKGRKPISHFPFPIFLQTFHHVGVIFVLWLGVCARTNQLVWGWDGMFFKFICTYMDVRVLRVYVNGI